MVWINILLLVICTCATGTDFVRGAYIDRSYYSNSRAPTYSQYDNNEDPDYVPTPNGRSNIYRGNYRGSVGREYGGYGPYYNQQPSIDYSSVNRYPNRGTGGSKYNQAKPSGSKFKQGSRNYDQRSHSEDSHEKRQSVEDNPVRSNNKKAETREQRRKEINPTRTTTANVQKKQSTPQQISRELKRTKAGSGQPDLRPKKQPEQRLRGTEEYVSQRLSRDKTGKAVNEREQTQEAELKPTRQQLEERTRDSVSEQVYDKLTELEQIQEPELRQIRQKPEQRIREEYVDSYKSVIRDLPKQNTQENKGRNVEDKMGQAPKEPLYEDWEPNNRLSKDSDQIASEPIEKYTSMKNEYDDDEYVSIDVEDETIELEMEKSTLHTSPKTDEEVSNEPTKPKGPMEGSRIDTQPSDIPAFPPGYPTGSPQGSFEYAMYETIEDQCSLQPEYGKCKGRYIKWYYDHDANTCKQFVFSGCGGNSNMFLSEEDCEDTCLIMEQESKDDVFDDTMMDSDEQDDKSMESLEYMDYERDDSKEVPARLDPMAKTTENTNSSTELSTLCGGCSGVPGTIQRPCITSLDTTCTDLKPIYRMEQCGPYKKDTCRIPDYSSYTYSCTMTVGKCCQCSRVLPDGHCEVPSCGEFGEWSPCCKTCGYTRMRFKTCMNKGYPWSRCIFTESELCLPEDLPNTTAAITSDTQSNSTTPSPILSNVKLSSLP